jgi:hypothetical protein
MNGLGKVRTRVRRAFLVYGPVLSTGFLIRFSYPRRYRFRNSEYTRVRQVAAEIADPSAEVAGRSHQAAMLWRARGLIELRAPTVQKFTGRLWPRGRRYPRGVYCSRDTTLVDNAMMTEQLLAC